MARAARRVCEIGQTTAGRRKTRLGARTGGFIGMRKSQFAQKIQDFEISRQVFGEDQRRPAMGIEKARGPGDSAPEVVEPAIDRRCQGCSAMQPDAQPYLLVAGAGSWRLAK